MRIILVVDKKANKFLGNLWNIGPVDKHSIITGDIVKSVKGAGLFKWNGEPWDDESPPVMVHNRQVTKVSEIQDLIGGLLIGEYETAIIGCDPFNTTIQLAHKLREVFGSENVTEVYPYLDKGFLQYRRLRIRIKELLNQIAIERVDVPTVAAVGTEEGATLKKQSLYLRVTLADTESVVNIILDEGTHLELDFRDGTQVTA